MSNDDKIQIPFNTVSSIGEVFIWGAFFLFVGLVYTSIAEHNKPTIDDLVNKVSVQQ